jgi:short-subunit dehydrogenase
MGMSPMKTTYSLVTGASSGIGRAMAEALVARGDALILSARRGDRLREIQEAYPEATIQVLEADLASSEGRQHLIDTCSNEGWEIETLINNAGLGYQWSFDSTPPDKIEAMVEVNVQALVELTYAFLPGMLERGRGSILNIGSVAGFQPLPGFALYGATKSFVLSFSEALYEENRRRGVFIGVLCPGPVDTEFQSRARMDLRWFAHSISPERVAQTALRQLRQRRPVQFTAFYQGCSAAAVGYLPRAWVRRLAFWMLRSTQRHQ